MKTCNAGEFKSLSDRTCKKCHSSCETCNGTTYKDCVSCDTEAFYPYLKDGQCVEDCSGNYMELPNFTCLTMPSESSPTAWKSGSYLNHDSV